MNYRSNFTLLPCLLHFEVPIRMYSLIRQMHFCSQRELFFDEQISIAEQKDCWHNKDNLNNLCKLLKINIKWVNVRNLLAINTRENEHIWALTCSQDKFVDFNLHKKILTIFVLSLASSYGMQSTVCLIWWNFWYTLKPLAVPRGPTRSIVIYWYTQNGFQWDFIAFTSSILMHPGGIFFPINGDQRNMIQF